ncbi:hypothetical protein BH11BAC7_BH11BAC7_18370 [soil metagenome]
MKKLVAFLMIALVSCTTSSKRTNIQEDIDAGKVLADKYYALVKVGSYHEASMLFGGEASPADAEALIVSLAEPQGELHKITFDSGKSEVAEENKKITGEIDLYYTVEYELLTKKEEFVLKFVDNKMVIAGFHSNLPGSADSK